MICYAIKKCHKAGPELREGRVPSGFPTGDLCPLKINKSRGFFLIDKNRLTPKNVIKKKCISILSMFLVCYFGAVYPNLKVWQMGKGHDTNFCVWCFVPPEESLPSSGPVTKYEKISTKMSVQFIFTIITARGRALRIVIVCIFSFICSACSIFASITFAEVCAW